MTDEEVGPFYFKETFMLRILIAIGLALLLASPSFAGLTGPMSEKDVWIDDEVEGYPGFDPPEWMQGTIACSQGPGLDQCWRYDIRSMRELMLTYKYTWTVIVSENCNEATDYYGIAYKYAKNWGISLNLEEYNWVTPAISAAAKADHELWSDAKSQGKDYCETAMNHPDIREFFPKKP